MIGIFDSGLGGLTVFKAIAKRLPEYQLVYVGDTARTPYGNRSQDLIYEFTRQAVDFLFKHGCQLVIIACNTASAEALRKIQQEWLPKQYPERRVLGVIRPVVEEITAMSKSKRIGVIATRGTVNSHAYIHEIKKITPTIEVFQQACPLLVPLVEEGWQGKPETAKIIRTYLKPLRTKNIDSLILGCTHYPILFKQIKKIAGRKVKVINPAVVVAEKLADYLVRHPEIETKLEKSQAYEFFVTDLTEQFQINAERFLGRKVELQKISL